MKFTIDTKTDSLERLSQVVKILQKHIKETEEERSKIKFNSSNSEENKETEYRNTKESEGTAPNFKQFLQLVEEKEENPTKEEN